VAEGRLRGFDLGGRRAIVYGAESAVGAAIVHAFREAGASVAVASASTGGDALFRLKKAAAGAPSAAVDLANATNVQVATRKLVKDLGGLDVAVVVPTAYVAGPIQKTSDADLDRVLGGALAGAYHVFRSAVRELAGKGDSGRLIAVLDGPAVRGLANVSAHAAAQAGVVGLVRALAQEVGTQGITVNAIVAGWLRDTPGRGPDDLSANLLQRFIPQRRFGAPDDVALLAVYLASAAAGYVSGHIASVDGGVLKHL